jgi:glycosyltransferase involved in cell wall biosynthesis
MPLTSKVALVIDALPAMGGAERVLMTAMELFPRAPIYTLVYDRASFTNTPIEGRRVYTSFLDKLPASHTQYRKYLPLMPNAIEKFNLKDYEVLISFHYAVAHGVITQPGQKHLSYTYTPMRYAWRRYGLNGVIQGQNKWVSGLFQPFRTWDTSAISHVEQIASVSGWIRDLVQRVYQRDSTVIYPPVEVDRFVPQAQRENYYISVSRLVAHKRIDLIVDAFNKLKLPLLIVGEGPERARLERRAQDNIRFLGFKSDSNVASLLNKARGYISACEEDFGISMVEAQAAGCPVIAYGQGGALETILEGQTGYFFKESDSTVLADAIMHCESKIPDCDPLLVAENAQRFNKSRFLDEFSAFVGKI